VKKISLLLVDDHTLFCESLATVLKTEMEEVEVVGIARDGYEALAIVERDRPDIVLMDVRMPRMDGVKATKAIHERFPGTRVIMLTTFDEDEYVRDAIKFGAVGYLLKDTALEKLIVAIRMISQEGPVMVSPSVVQRLAQEAPAASIPKAESPSLPSWLKELSRREREILRLIAKGCANSEIAERLSMAEQTVKNHLSDIYLKIGVHDRVKMAVLLARLPPDALDT
jgi:DNA-binding NarL/FixJ family response regulator